MATAQVGARPWPRTAGLIYGADYNPEQWPEETWPEDIALMQAAGVTMVTVGVFSWALLEPSAGRFEFGWLDRVMDLLAAGGIAVDLATATASPPPWFSRTHPGSLPVTADGRTLWWGGRQAYCPSSPDYRSAAVALARSMALRYRDHPALALWHVGNEYGCHVAHCYCDASAAAFRAWLQQRYGGLAELNAAWGTTFWSQYCHTWADVIPPRAVPAFGNPTQQLDWWRFSSDALLDLYRAERDVLRELSPDVPVTTNFMLAQFKPVDYAQWAPEVDVVSHNHYLQGTDPAPEVDLALAADLSRSLADGRPWILMENSTSAVNWQPRNLAKTPGQLRRNALANIARGADGIMFFQWRASRAGAEKYHSALLPHAGTDTKIWRESVALGAELRELAGVQDSRVETDVAILWDWPSWWSVEFDSHPSIDVRYLDAVRRSYEVLWNLGVTVDFAHPESELGGYRLVLAPSLYLLSAAGAANLTAFVHSGGRLVTHYFSAIADEVDHIGLGGYPAALREVLGLRVEEFFPLAAGAEIRLDDGSYGRIWSELLQLEGATSVLTYADGPLAGVPVITRNAWGSGAAWYVGTSLAGSAHESLLRDVLAESGVSTVDSPAGVEVVRRGDRLFIINHTAADAEVAENVVAPGDVAIVSAV